jgi:hypothetical protein
MKINQYSEQIFDEGDLCDLVMSGVDLGTLDGMIVDATVNIDTVAELLDRVPQLVACNESTQSVREFDQNCQSNWHMPVEYQQLDVVEHVLSLCKTDAELQRVGAELLLYQERDLFDLLRYLKYLVDTMTTNRLIWGVGRGSSVASYVLYLLGVHRIDSMYYELDPEEFLR